ncbi:MAG: homocysteine S-methyltransferase family protein [Miltoncostaeaceae bacterium]
MKHREALPQLNGRFLITDGGLETDLIFNRGFDLPAFASFPLVGDPKGREALTDYFNGFARIAREGGHGLLLESPTWRANADWAAELGIDMTDVDELNRQAAALLLGLREGYEGGIDPIVVSGNIGPRGDGYVMDTAMDVDEATEYQGRQVEVFADAGVDMVSAFTMTYAAEAAGVVRAANQARVPAAISFTVETDGRLPSGQPLAEAIAEVDGAGDGGPAYYMVNCAHPTHFEDVFEEGGEWTERIAGLRSNASKASHEELDEATELDDGDPAELSQDHVRLKRSLPHLTVLGGCCGTDHRHVGEIGAAWRAAA